MGMLVYDFNSLSAEDKDGPMPKTHWLANLA